MSAIYEAAIAADTAGISVLPIKSDGTKAAAVSWKPFQRTRPTRQLIDQWFAAGAYTGYALVCGPLSGNPALGLEVLDFDDPDTYQLFLDTAESIDGLREIVATLRAGYEARTPDGGAHLAYLCATVAGNQKLAMRPGPNPAMPRKGAEVMIETRGTGGYFIGAGSNGRVHPSGRGWTLAPGSTGAIPAITPAQREQLLALAKSLTLLPPEAPHDGSEPTAEPSGTRPGDEFRAKHGTLETFRPLIERHGWTFVHARGGVGYFRRPGKDNGWSATFGHAGTDFFYVFSASTVFEAERAYNPFAVYVLLEHGGDFSAAGKALSEAGYGDQMAVLTFTARDGTPAPDPTGAQVDPHATDCKQVYLSAQNQHTKEVAAAAWTALVQANDPPALFVYANQPTRLVFSPDGAPAPQPLDEAKLAHHLARAVTWYRVVKNPVTKEFENKYAHPPQAIVKDMIAATEFPFPHLRRIILPPSYAENGSLAVNPGYHADSEAYYVPNGLQLPTIPKRPTDSQVAAARDLINDEVFVDFPFVGDADRAHAFAMLLLQFVRNLVKGPTPLTMISKPKAGTGATLLVDGISGITTGRPPAIMTQGGSEDEWRKRITSTLRPLPSLVLIDNVAGRLESANLAAALTATIWSDRILGESNNAEIPVTCTWAATGNNVGVSGEIARRIVPIQLDAKVERPHMRSGFRHPSLIEWIQDHRGELVAACLTLCQAWFANGKPAYSSHVRLGGYESWSRVMGGVLEVAGIDGFLSNLRRFQDHADSETDVIRAFLERWWSDHGQDPVVLKTLVGAATDVGVNLGRSDSDRSVMTALGLFVKRLRDQVYTLESGQMIRITDDGKDSVTKAQRWKLDIPLDTEPTEATEPVNSRARNIDRDTAIYAPTGGESEGSASSGGSVVSAIRTYTHPACGTEVAWGEDCPVCKPRGAA